MGRFVSADSIAPGVGSASLNRYMYVEGNPLRFVDPTGHCAGLTGIAFSACKATVMAAAAVVNKANEYREDIFFPGQDTTFGERLEACTVVGDGATLSAAGGVAGAQATSTAANAALLRLAVRYPWMARALGLAGAAATAELADGDNTEGNLGGALLNSGEVGAARVQQVVDNYGDDVLEVGRQIKIPNVGSTDIDVVLRNNTFIEVGGPSKAWDLSKFGTQLKLLTEYAKSVENGRVIFHYAPGTPQSVIDLAVRRLGESNVLPIPGP